MQTTRHEEGLSFSIKPYRPSNYKPTYAKNQTLTITQIFFLHQTNPYFHKRLKSSHLANIQKKQEKSHLFFQKFYLKFASVEVSLY